MKNIIKSLVISAFAVAWIAQPAYAYDDGRWEHRDPRWHAQYSHIVYQPAPFYYYAAPTVAYYPQPVYQVPSASLAVIIR